MRKGQRILPSLVLSPTLDVIIEYSYTGMERFPLLGGWAVKRAG